MPLSMIKDNHKRACHGNGFTIDEKVVTVESCIPIIKERSIAALIFLFVCLFHCIFYFC